MKTSFFKGVPYNALIFAALAVFLMQVALMLYYNKSVFVFPNIESYLSLNKAADIADNPARAFTRNVDGKKEANGFLYPVLASVILKAVGPGNIVLTVYILDLLMLAFILIVYYKIACEAAGKEAAFASTLVFAVSAPAVTSMFSGSDAAVMYLFFAAAMHGAVFGAPKKKFAGLFIAAGLMALTGYMGAVYAACFVMYAFFKMSEKGIKRNYAAVWAAVSIFAVAASALLFYVFVDSLSMEYLKNNGLLDIKTFNVDTYFKDGFLWSKAVPPFFSIFFFLAVFMGLAQEIRSKSVTFMTLTGLLTVVSLLAGFFSMFSVRANSYMFMAPFYMALYIAGTRGVVDFAGYLEEKGGKTFTKANIVAGFMVFMVIYNLIFTFTRLTELDGNIHYLTGDTKVSRFFPK